MHKETPSRQVTSQQDGVHDKLDEVVQRHRSHAFCKPIAPFNQQAFEQAGELWQRQGGALILDSGCGVGASTRYLARQFPEHFVIGIDRSDHRLQRQWGELPNNACLIRADLVDFWRLALAAGWHPDYHYLLYPNPSPKKKDLKLRWHGHPVFPDLVALGGVLECRSNWKLYLQEMQQALSLFDIKAQLEPLLAVDDPVTPFERKYAQSGHELWSLRAQLDKKTPD